MNTKTLPAMVRLAGNAIPDGVTRHEPTKNNRLGQSGRHTFVDDIISIVLGSSDEAEANKALHKYLEVGEL